MRTLETTHSVESFIVDSPTPTPHIPRGNSIILAGCLGMVYTQLTLSPAVTEFALALGGNAFHIGFLGAVPTGMLFLQFVSAVLSNHLTHRRGLWIGVSIVQRLLLVPVALGPVLLPNVSNHVWLMLLLSLSTINQGLMHFASPLWMSWMADYLPRDGLSRFWGYRQLWMHWSGAAALLGAAICFSWSAPDIIPAFATLTLVAALLGVVDILIFFRVSEPPVTKVPETRLSKVLTEPFRNRDFRSFISFMCFWHFAAMIGSPFISLYLISVIGMSVSQLMLLWVFCWVGGALCSGQIGRLAERYGHRPILIICTALKSSNMLALVLMPANADLAFALLVPVFVLDSVLNAGFTIASNSFMMTTSPPGNRTMYIAAGTALAGLVGGIASLICGGVLEYASPEVSILGGEWNGFQILFAVSIILRTASMPLVMRIREPRAGTARQVMVQIINTTPLRMIRFPVGLFRSDDCA